MADARQVVVSKEWYAELQGYLLPSERWVTRTEAFPNATLFVHHFDSGDSTRLIFVPDVVAVGEVEGVSA